MEIDLGRDAFTITYDLSKVDVQAIMEKIRGLGYRPEMATTGQPELGSGAKPRGAIPEPVAGALAAARRDNRLVLINFSAAWCGPCKVLEAEILVDLQVQEVLERYTLLKVDTDQYVKPSERFEVVGLPTLLVLDSTGVELFRHVGMIDSETLAQKLTALAEEQH